MAILHNIKVWPSKDVSGKQLPSVPNGWTWEHSDNQWKLVSPNGNAFTKDDWVSANQHNPQQ